MDEELKKEFVHLDSKSFLELVKACKATRLKAIDQYNTLLKIYFITGGDLNNAEQFFDYVDKIAVQMKGA